MVKKFKWLAPFLILLLLVVFIVPSAPACEGPEVWQNLIIKGLVVGTCVVKVIIDGDVVGCLRFIERWIPFILKNFGISYEYAAEFKEKQIGGVLLPERKVKAGSTHEFEIEIHTKRALVEPIEKLTGERLGTFTLEYIPEKVSLHKTITVMEGGEYRVDLTEGLAKHAVKMWEANPARAVKVFQEDPKYAVEALQTEPEYAAEALQMKPERAMKEIQANPARAVKLLEADPAHAPKLLQVNPRHSVRKVLMADPAFSEILQKYPTGLRFIIEASKEPFHPPSPSSKVSKEKAKAVLDKYEEELLSRPYVAGLGISKDEEGYFIVVFLTRKLRSDEELPKSLDGVRVTTEVTGPFEFLPKAQK